MKITYLTLALVMAAAVHGQTPLIGPTTNTPGTVNNTVPAWLKNTGTGADGANTTASGNLSGEKFYTNFAVPFGNTVTVNSPIGLQIHATGTCTIAGTINARGQDTTATFGFGGGSGGGSGGGAAAGTAGSNSALSEVAMFNTAVGGGTAGAISGGAGGNGSTPSASPMRIVANSGGGIDGTGMSGGPGKAGGSAGGALGNGGSNVVLICAAISGTDGTHTGTIDVSGQNGTNSASNSTGSGSGGGGGVILLSSQAAIATPPTMTVTGGSGGTCGAFTTCGAGGAGGNGWTATFTGW